MEQTREFKLTIELYHDTNKQTRNERHEFDNIEDAQEWLAEYAASLEA